MRIHRRHDDSAKPVPQRCREFCEEVGQLTSAIDADVMLMQMSS
jgi:hypothetical protein